MAIVTGAASSKQFMKPKILNASNEIEYIAKKNRLSYISATILYCERKKLEVEFVSTLLSEDLQDKIENEARRLFLIKKTT